MTPNPLSAERMREIRDGILGVSRTEITYRPGSEHLPVPVATSPVVIVVGGGLMQWESFVQARLLGFRVVMTDRNPECFMAKHADEFVAIDVFDGEAHVYLVNSLRLRGYTVAGIFVGGIDAEVTAATVAERCGLPGLRRHTAERCRDKSLMRMAFVVFGRAPGLKVEWQLVGDSSDVQAPLLVALGRDGALVVKPIGNSASRGVQIVRKLEDLQPAIEHAKTPSTGYYTVIVEEYVAGTQHSVEIARVGDSWVRLNIVDRVFDTVNPVLELGHLNPTSLKTRDSLRAWKREGDVSQEDLYELAEAAADAVGVKWGVFKCDMVVGARGPVVLECTARLSGGFDSQVTTPLRGLNFVALGLALATGRQVYQEWYKGYSWEQFACVGVFPPPGEIVDLYTERDAPSIHFYNQSRYSRGADIYRHGRGDTIQPYRDCGARPAFVVRGSENDIAYGTYRSWEYAVRCSENIAAGYSVRPVGDQTRPYLPRVPFARPPGETS